MKKEVIGSSELYHGDCMELMATLADKSIDFAIVDPPYGIGEDWRKNPHSPFYRHKTSYGNQKISAEFFEELFRVSKDQVIFGANYYTKFLEERNSWIVWDKSPPGGRLFNSDCELAWTSFNKKMKIARFVWNGFYACELRYGKHPHEKPVKLYSWILSNYAKPGMKILDTHLGSGSSAIACNEMGFPLVACEIEAGYFATACKRVRLAAAQGMFEFESEGAAV